VTAEGLAFLKENQGIVDTLTKRMAEANQIFGDGPPPGVIRAVRNLKHTGATIRQRPARQGRGPGDYRDHRSRRWKSRSAGKGDDAAILPAQTQGRTLPGSFATLSIGSRRNMTTIRA
jgi:hypothetical protein